MKIETIDDLIALIQDRYVGRQSGMYVIKPASTDTVREILTAAIELKASMEADELSDFLVRKERQS